MKPINVLVIGCGNIGAGYDFHKRGKVLTHAKAFATAQGVKLFVADRDPEKAEVVARKHKAEVLPLNDRTDYRIFSIISITTPTATHAKYLGHFLRLQTPVIICEKPVAASLQQLRNLKRAYEKSNSRVVVNYIRRFQPAYALLKRQLQDASSKERLQAIHIRYQKGLLNNGTHALDLLEYLFEKSVSFKKFTIVKTLTDYSKTDLTVSGTGVYLDAALTITGLPMGPPVFEIDFHFSNKMVQLKNSGSQISHYKLIRGSMVEQKSMRQTGVLNTYMNPVIAHSLRLLKRGGTDNFLQALELNANVLKQLEKV